MTPLIDDETDIVDHLHTPIKIGDIVVCAYAVGKAACMRTGMVLRCAESEKQITLRIGFVAYPNPGKTTVYDHKYKVDKKDRRAERVTVVTNLIDPNHKIFDMKAYIG